jgi:hypothetical protein
MPKDTKIITKLKNIAKKYNWVFYEGYSDRYMVHKQCAGIITDNPSKCLKITSKDGIRRGKIDSMCNKYIVYWPDIECLYDTER